MHFYFVEMCMHFYLHFIICRLGQVILFLHNEIYNYSIKFLLKLRMNISFNSNINKAMVHELTE